MHLIAPAKCERTSILLLEIKLTTTTARFVCATSKETSDTVCLTSYKSLRGNNDLVNSVKIWEACRATSAASSFFDSISIGRYNEEFLDGATGANNPVVELWDQAQLMWGPEPLEARVQCVISIGTGIPSLKPFRDDVMHIGETLVAISTETEQTAERFRRDKAHLDSGGRYFRFNVVRGLEDIGLEETTKAKDIAAATRRYVSSQEAFKQMQICAGNLRTRDTYSSPESPKDQTAMLAAMFNSLVPEIVVAAKDGDDALVEELIQKGANVNAKSALDNLPPLWWAANKGYPRVAKVLIDSGKASVDFKDGYGMTPLLWAVHYGHDSIVKLLLQTGKVDVNVKDNSRRTPLSHAAEQGHEAVVRLLLQTGKAHVNEKDTWNKTPLVWATERGHESIVKILKRFT